MFIDWGLADDCAQRPQQAIEHFKQSIALEKTAHAYALLGMVHVKHNEPAEAMPALDEAEKLDPTFEMLYVYRGNMYLLGQDFEKAAAQFQKALSLSPVDPAARDGLDLAQRHVKPTITQ
jgi:tetratricopeptide (TPR) repeat protein